MRRITQYTYGGENLSGIDSYLRDAAMASSTRGIGFDLLYRYAIPYSTEAQESLVRSGATFESLGVPETKSPLTKQIREIRGLRTYFRQHRPTAVEINMTSTFMILTCMIFAAAGGVRVRIVHAHDSYPHEHPGKRALKAVFTPILNRLATARWACSRDAAVYLFGSRRVEAGDWTLVRNAIDASKFEFNADTRAQTRSKLKIDEHTLCVGVVGRFTPQKNQIRALRIFSDLLQIHPRSVMLLVGDGETQEATRSVAAQMNLPLDAVKFLGRRDDLPDLYNALDVLLAPSIHEGFPITALEAQAAGLPLVVSEAYPRESNIAGKMIFHSLDEENSVWAHSLATSIDHHRTGGAALLETEGFDQRDIGAFLEEAYERALRKRDRQ